MRSTTRLWVALWLARAGRPPLTTLKTTGCRVWERKRPSVITQIVCSTISQPWGADLAPGQWQGSSYNIETKVKSENYAATCRVKFDAGPGDLSIIGGAFFQKIGGYKYRQVATPGLGGGTNVGLLDMDGDGWGWRAGLAYEVPEIALRASLVYNSAVDMDLDGTIDLTNVPVVPGYGGLVTPVYGNVSMPDSIELKLQSGIAPDWLAFGSVKWTDWS